MSALPGSLSFSLALEKYFQVGAYCIKHDRRYILRHADKVSRFKEKSCISEALILLKECGVKIGSHQKKKKKTQPVNPKHTAC